MKFISQKIQTHHKQAMINNNDDHIFDNYPHWTFNKAEKQAQTIITKILSNTIKDRYEQCSTIQILNYFHQIKQTPLFQLLQTMPKAVMHHNHIQCNVDYEFIVTRLKNDPKIYLTNAKILVIADQITAKQNNWQSCYSFANSFINIHQFQVFINNKYQITSHNIQGNQIKNIWNIFESKIAQSFQFIYAEDIFFDYLLYVFNKFCQNGYQLLQFRGYISKLTKYDNKGNTIQTLPYSIYTHLFDKAVHQTQQSYPNFTIYYICSILKRSSDQQNKLYIKQILSLNWSKLKGIDFVNKQDDYLSISHYDQILQNVLQSINNINVTKVYHAGQTNNPNNNNIQQALTCGSKRIGHGLNLLNHPHLFQKIKQTCVQICPISNLILGYVNDLRKGVAPQFFKQGIPITINPDDPGIFGTIDTTYDFFVALMYYNWTIRHLKLTCLYSIEYSLCNLKEKQELLGYFEDKWQKWIEMINTKYI